MKQIARERFETAWLSNPEIFSKKMKIAEGCVEEYKKFSMLDFSTIEDEIRNSIEVPEYPYAVEKDIGLSVNDEMSDIDMDGISVMDESEDYDISLNAEVCEQISAEDTMDATVGAGSKANIVEKYIGDRSDDKGSYEAYKKMTPLEKAQTVLPVMAVMWQLVR